MSSAVDLSLLDEDRPPLPVIYGVAGKVLNDDEKAFFRDADPLGLILFARNCETPAQIRALTAQVFDAVGRVCPVLIDQEGGRVRRLKPPHWHDVPSARDFGDLVAEGGAASMQSFESAMRALADELSASWVNVNCAPVLDVLCEDTHEAIGDRAYGGDPALVGDMGAALCAAFLQRGVIPVMKHLPGQGRAASDSHHDLPVVHAPRAVLEDVDFAPFRAVLRKTWSEGVWGMVAHIVYPALDERAPASCSRRVIYDVIRGAIGFKGLLLSDDIGMGALEMMGAPALRAEKVLRAGCDIALHCDGNLQDMKNIAARVEKMTKEALLRYNHSVSWINDNVRERLLA